MKGRRPSFINKSECLFALQLIAHNSFPLFCKNPTSRGQNDDISTNPVTNYLHRYICSMTRWLEAKRPVAEQLGTFPQSSYRHFRITNRQQTFCQLQNGHLHLLNDKMARGKTSHGRKARDISTSTSYRYFQITN